MITARSVNQDHGRAFCSKVFCLMGKIIYSAAIGIFILSARDAGGLRLLR